MKTLITSTGDSLNSGLDPRFGRGAWFCIFNDETEETTFIQNEFKDAEGGAGTKVAEQVINLEIKRVISGDFGPKAKSLLDKFEVQLIKFQDESLTVKDMIASLKS